MDRGNEWTRPVGPEVTARARTGDWSVVLIGYEPVPRDWFPANIKGIAVLCLASGADIASVVGDIVNHRDPIAQTKAWVAATRGKP